MQTNYPDLNKVKLQQRIEGIQNLKYSNILEKSFVSLLCGKPGSGKTTLIEQFLLNPDLYYKKFDYVFILSPSRFQNLELDPNNCNNMFDMRWICEKLVEIKQKNIKQKFNMLFVFDDMISQIKENEKSRVLQDLFFNRRNIIDNCTISILVTSQKFTTCPTVVRNVLTSLYIFSVTPWEWEIIRKQQMRIDAKELKEIQQNVFKSKNDFLYITTDPFKIYHKFKPILLKSDYKDLQQQLYANNQLSGETSQQQQKKQKKSFIQQKNYETQEEMDIENQTAEENDIEEVQSESTAIQNSNSNNKILQNQIKALQKQINQMQQQKQQQQQQKIKQKQQITEEEEENNEYYEISEEDEPEQPIIQRKQNKVSSFEQFLNESQNKKSKNQGFGSTTDSNKIFQQEKQNKKQTEQKVIIKDLNSFF